MKIAVIALLGLTQTINLAHKGEPKKEEELAPGEKPVWREY